MQLLRDSAQNPTRVNSDRRRWVFGICGRGVSATGCFALGRRLAVAFICLMAGAGWNPVFPQSQAPPSEKAADAFFAGTVEEVAADHVSVSRVAQGKKEKREFHLTSDTKVEGRLRTKVRVTVRYSSGDEGDTATLIIIRATTAKQK